MTEGSSEHPRLAEGIRGIWRHARPYRGQLWWLAALGLISAAANGAVPFVTGRFFDALIALSRGTPISFDGLPLWGVLLGAWALVQLLANSTDWIMDRTRREVDMRVHLGIQTTGFEHIYRLPLSFHTNEHINGVLSKISMAAWRVSAIMQSLTQIAPQLLSVLIGITLAASISPQMARILALGVAIYVTLLIYKVRPIAAVDHRAHELWNESWNDAAQAALQAASVKEASAEEYESGRVRSSLMGTVYDLWMRLQWNWSDINFFQRVIVFLTQLSVFILSVQAVAAGTLTVGDLVALNGYALLFFGPFVSLGGSWQVIQNGITAAGQLERLFATGEEKYRFAGARTAAETSGRVAFDHVSFRYESEKPVVLTDLSFAVEPGQVVAFVGESGSGKSTTISLVSGYYFPDAGSVRVDGVDTREWDLSALRSRIAVVPQEVALFNDTVRANIRYGAFGATDAAVEEAARQAHIDDYVRSLPEAYNTLVGERGIKLSVGQKQRIAIARAILRDPEILILDEPTSALDSETERLITASLEKLMKGRTTFIIAHRLSTVRRADLILLLKDGRVAEKGTHDELMAMPDGNYRRLYELHIGLRD